MGGNGTGACPVVRSAGHGQPLPVAAVAPTAPAQVTILPRPARASVPCPEGRVVAVGLRRGSALGARAPC